MDVYISKTGNGFTEVSIEQRATQDCIYFSNDYEGTDASAVMEFITFLQKHCSNLFIIHKN